MKLSPKAQEILEQVKEAYEQNLISDEAFIKIVSPILEPVNELSAKTLLKGLNKAKRKLEEK